jgi:hypothetical protein
LNAYVAAGSALAIFLIMVRCVGPHEWRSPRNWHIPEVGPSLIVLLGCNALTAAVKLLMAVITNHIRVKGAHGIEELGSEDIVVFLGGALSAFLVGVSTIRAGWKDI